MFSYTSTGIKSLHTKNIYSHMLLAIQVRRTCRKHPRWPPVSTIFSSHSGIICNRYLRLLSNSFDWYRGQTIINYPKLRQSVALPFFNCISQDALTNLIQENFFFSFLAICQPPGKIIQCRTFYYQLERTIYGCLV